MSGDNMLEKALADVRQRRIDLQAEYERVTAELNKLRMAERSLAVIVEGAAAEEVAALDPTGEGTGRSGRATGRGSRGPRANSAKGRLKALLESTGQQGLSHAEIERRLPDVAPATLNAYLSTMVSSGDAVRRGDFYVGAAPSAAEEPAAEASDAEARDEAAE
ncbi:hypothetical protein Q8W71_01810 [Methylobacterium sp. NEAU 140]|uniref:hypothetical protein n=1 Tax=Methylobacterium sp. NEAU 140 TaxID=3064945 RepID=UPI002732898C|nr:hypothetical protein [Methylobacterium sp. NEAU 140]MDP4021345.1 hypothetical protein [Methylobacterium sp. NEAU 140]